MRPQPYEFTVTYRPGPQNIADALSRLTREVSNENQNVAEYIRYVAEPYLSRKLKKLLLKMMMMILRC